MSFPLRADIYKVGNRYYRRNPLQNGRTRRQKELYGDTPDLYGGNDDSEPRGSTNCERESAVSEADAHNTEVVCGQETSINNAPIVCEEDPRISFCSGKWIAKVDVPSEFHTRLFGTRGTIRKNLEESTQCRLTIPRKGRCEPIEVKSFISLECVQRCLDRIDIILVEARSKARFTHFLSLPCEDQSEIIEAFERFKQSVLCNDCVSPSCKISSIFVPPSKLHVTICMLWIFNETDLHKAITIIRDARPDILNILNGDPLLADIDGINTWEDDASSVNVVFAVVKGDILQKVCDMIRSRLAASSFSPLDVNGVSVYDSGVRMHMSLMRNQYASKRSKFSPFDAKSLLTEYKNFHFGTVILKKISICFIHSTDYSTGSYKKVFELDLQE